MKYLLITLLCLCACESIAEEDKAEKDPGWADRAALGWAKDLGEDSAKESCLVWRNESTTATCSVRIDNSINKVRCFYHQMKCRPVQPGEEP